MRKFRVASLVVVTGIFIWSLCLTFHPTTPPQKIDLLKLSSEALTIYQAARSDSDQFFQIGLLVLGGLWTVAVAGKDTKMRTGDGWEMGCFALTCVLFVFFFMGYQSYRDTLTDMSLDFFKLNKLADPSDPWIKTELSRVGKLFYMALGASAITVFSLSLFRGSAPEGK